jgi:hypothetical protein
MAISYPLSLPTTIGIANIELRAKSAVAISQSPFTFKTQTIVYQGQMWAASITIPPVKRQDAESWIAFLLALNGPQGTFLLGDPNGTALRGTATAATITGSAGSSTVSAVVPSGETLLAGDYIQLGTGSDSTLHKVVQNYTGTGSSANLEIWPRLRKVRSSVSATLSNARGLFRLSNQETSFNIGTSSSYGIQFECMEAVV